MLERLAFIDEITENSDLGVTGDLGVEGHTTTGEKGVDPEDSRDFLGKENTDRCDAGGTRTDHCDVEKLDIHGFFWKIFWGFFLNFRRN